MEFERLKSLWTSSYFNVDNVALNLSSIAEDMDSPHCLEAAELLFMSSNQKLHEVGVKALQITGKSQHPDAFKAAIMIYKKGRNQEEREEGENILRIMVDDALDNHHSFHASIALLGYTTSVDANDKKLLDNAKSKWSSWSKDIYSLAVPIFVAIGRTSSHPNRFEVAKLLWQSYLEHYNGVGAQLLQEIGLDTHDPNAYDAAKLLWKSSYSKYYSKAVPVLEKIGLALEHPHSFDAAELLWNSSLTANNNTGKRVLEQICEQKDRHTNAFDAAVLLWNCEKDSNHFASEYFELIMTDSGGQNQHPLAYRTAKYLFEGNINQRMLARKHLDSYLRDIESEQNFEVAELYWKELAFTEEYQLARQCFRQIAAQVFHHRRFEVARLLWKSSDEDDREIARGVLTFYATQPNHEYTIEAISTLWDGGRECDHQVLHPLIAAAAGNVFFPEEKRKKLVKLLRESPMEEDQSLGIALFATNFVTLDKCHYFENKQHFNMTKVRSVMPQPLSDLSHVSLDLVQEVSVLIDLMSGETMSPNGITKVITQEENPFFVSIEAVTGGDYSAHASNYDFVKSHCLGFLKTLVGQPLTSGEKSGWQMHVEHKSAMINSLKHIILQVKHELASSENDKETIQRAMLSLGIVINGILHCPTGQAEGIESAVNMVVRKQHIVSSDVCDLVGHLIIASAVTKSFYNAFHTDGAVHQLSRARLVLQEELGLSHAITDFKEQISKVLDDEIPDIYNQFYKVFTVQFVIAEARRNIPDALESKLLQESHWNKMLRDKCRAIKMNKPITLSALIGWLHDQGESDTEQLHTVYGIAEDYLSISDRGLQNIFIKMGYLQHV